MPVTISLGICFLLGLSGAASVLAESTDIQWAAYTRSTLKQARGTPVLVDVNAAWCQICHEMDRTTFRDPRVIESAQRFVMVTLDATDPNRAPASSFIDRYALEGVPTLVVFDARGRERRDLRREGYVSAEEVLDVMRAMQQ